MTEQQDKNEEQPAAQLRRDKEIPLDTRLLSEAVIELNISRKNVGIYPPGHIQITNSINHTFEILQRLFEIRTEMTLGVAKDTLLVGQDYLDQRNPVYRDFALSLNQQDIASVTFIRGLDKDELVRFHRIITTKPETIRAEGGISAIIDRAAIPHIRIQAVDYGSFHVTEEAEIIKASAPKTGSEEKARAGHSVWRDFVSHLTGGTLAGAGSSGVLLKDAEQIDPAELAALLNERRIDSGSALQSYDKIISEHVRVQAEQKQLTNEQSTTLRNMSALLKNLHPELRKQFLSVAFREISTHTSAAGGEELLGGFPDDIVIEMLTHASEEGKAISPTLTGLLGKLTRAQAQNAKAGSGGSFPAAPGSEDEAASSILPEHMSRLFERENYEEYVPDDYQETLKRLAESAVSVGEKIPVDDYARTLEDDHLDFQIGRALIAFMEEDIDEEDYEQFAKKLILLMPEFLKTGNFTLLLDILQTLRKQSQDKPSGKLRSVAEACLAEFAQPAFIEQSVHAFDGWARTRGREAADFLYALGPAALPGLMDIYAIDTTPGGRRVLFELLARFGANAVREAVRRLRDPRPHYVRNLVMLIRRAGSADSLPSLKFLLNNADVKVRMEVLTTMLWYRDPEGVRILRETLHVKDPDIVSQAVFYAGQYRVAEVTDALLALIRRVVLFETDYTVNEEIIKALGEIGDVRAIPELERLARARALSPQRRLKMQRFLFRSLGRYPRESIARLIEMGEQTQDEVIRQLCRKLREENPLKRGGQA
ncbi:MAG TPA: hypothetical protein VK654_17490 [Nitrospirota bacterium]|nr:hypothetical protein [Nitrospirota bacterium]